MNFVSQISLLTCNDYNVFHFYFHFTVDRDLPEIICPHNKTVTIRCARSTPVTFPVVHASDKCSSINVTYYALGQNTTFMPQVHSSATLNAGNTTITAQAVDGNNNTATCTTTIEVLRGMYSPGLEARMKLNYK